MENTPHVMLSGDGALEFALQNGFVKEDLLTPGARERWQQWVKEKKNGKSDLNNHDTIGMLAIDKKGQIAGACTTSGLAWKTPGRVGDSPIIGAGLFIDGDVGGAVATGRGEAVIKIAGTHLIVELMRMGKTPQEACEEAISRIVRKQRDHQTFQVGFIAVSIKGEVGAYSLTKGFQYAVQAQDKKALIDATHRLQSR
jgi:isoaspartyl peptidase/L-asparaginase-like protein (Ntn-hydrolase superfamily)